MSLSKAEPEADIDSQTVFVVDDDPEVRFSVGRSLLKRGFKVASFASAEEFLEHFGSGKPGCLILDYGLPGMNGLDLQSHLIDEKLSIPIIFVTGHGGIPESVKATKAGAIDFLEKPYRPSDLAERVKTALEINRIELKTRELKGAIDASLSDLTQREREVFDLIIARPELSSSKGVALELGISPRTVDKHRAQVLLKTGCRTVAELIGRYSAT